MPWTVSARLGAASLLLGLCLGAPAPARPLPSTPTDLLTEGATGVRFQSYRSVAGVTYRCLGVGAKKFLAFPIYAVAFCMETSQAELAIGEYVRATHPDRSGDALAKALASDQRFFEALSDAPGDKLIELHFLRDLPRERLAAALRKNLGRYLAPVAADRVASSVSADARQGSVALLRTSGSSLVFELAGRWAAFDDGAALAPGVFRVWLGRESVTPGIKVSIAQNIAASIGAP